MNATLIRPHLCPLALSLLCIAAILLPDAWQTQLHYQRSAVLDGEAWRLLTTHLTHLNAPHLLMNLVGLWFIWLLFFMQEAALPLCLYRLPAIFIGTALALLLFSPDVVWYRGLSGALHGLLVLGLLLQWPAHRHSSSLLLLLLAAKIAWEQMTGPVPGSETWIEGRVIVDSHLYGAIWGGLIWLLVRRKSPLKKHEVAE